MPSRTPSIFKLLILFASLILFISSAGRARCEENPRIKFDKDVEYSAIDGEHLALNIAYPGQSEGLLPAILFVHGGGFRAGSRDSYNNSCVKYAQHGYVAATVTHRLAPKFPYPAAIYDVKAAVRWLRANREKYHIDPTRIGVTGSSAGGHLAQFLGVTMGVARFEGQGGDQEQSSAVQCVVNEYGPSDFTKSIGKSVDAAEVLPLFFGGDLESTRHKYIQGSPLNWVTPAAAPTLILHGTDDKYVAFEQATWMKERLEQCGVEVILHQFDGAGHGFKGADAELAEKLMMSFFDSHLKRKQ